MFDALWSHARVAAGGALDVLRYPPDPESAARMQSEQFAAVCRNTPGMMAANMCNALVLLSAFIDTPLRARAALWMAAVFCVSGFILFRARRPRRARHDLRGPTSVGRRAAAYALLLGSLWSAVPVLFFLDASASARLLVISLTAGMLFGGAFALARAPLAATAFSAPIALAAAATLIHSGDADLSRIAIVLCVYVSVLLRGVYVEARSFKHRLLTQIGVERQARTDPLTELPNRLAFADAIEREIARTERYGGGFLLICVDIDNFKTINDRFGHPAGDELLAQAARRMRAALRASDLVARLGGDEFAIIATNVKGETAAHFLAERIVSCFSEPFLLEGRAVTGAASVGGALAPRDGADYRALFKCADVALYQAKQQGGGWRLFQPEKDDAASVEPLALAAAPGETLRRRRAGAA
jgi:diguanylate cyclase (GGDEF)-like protein